MLEFVGFIVVVLVAWAVVKRVTAGAVQITLRRAKDFAVEHGVPLSFARSICSNPTVLKTMRAKLAQNDADFAANDAYLQYGSAILEIFDEHELRDGIAAGVESILKPQIDSLRSEGIHVPVTEITLVYVAALVIGLSARRAMTLELARYAAQRAFCQPEYLLQLENAFAIALRSPDFFDKVAKLLPVAQKEASTYLGSFSRDKSQTDSASGPGYYVRYAKYLNRQAATMMQNGANSDLGTAPLVNFVDV